MIVLKSANFCFFNLVLKRHISSKYDVFASIVLQRSPVIAPQMNVIERTLNSVTQRFETLNSLYSDHEVKHFRDVEREKVIAAKKTLDETEMEASVQQTALEMEDKWEKELSQFSFASAVTDEDKSGNTKSLNRCLDKNLMLLCKLSSNKEGMWQFPRTQHKEGETLRQSVDRLLTSMHHGIDFEVKVMGNCPCAVHSLNLPVKLRTEIIGAKIFFFKAQLIKGNLDLKNCAEIADYQWVNRSECKQLLAKRYWKDVHNSLLMEELHPETITRIITKIRNKLEKSELNKVSVRN